MVIEKTIQPSQFTLWVPGKPQRWRQPGRKTLMQREPVVDDRGRPVIDERTGRIRTRETDEVRRNPRTGSPIVLSFPEKDVETWKALAMDLARMEMHRRGLRAPVYGRDVPLVCTVIAMFPARKNQRRREWKVTMPDGSQVKRLAVDALSGLVYGDDKQVVNEAVYKLVCGPDESPGVAIRVSPMLLAPQDLSVREFLGRRVSERSGLLEAERTAQQMDLAAAFAE